MSKLEQYMIAGAVEGAMKGIIRNALDVKDMDGDIRLLLHLMKENEELKKKIKKLEQRHGIVGKVKQLLTNKRQNGRKKSG